MTEQRTPPIEINYPNYLFALTYSADGEHLLGGTTDGVQVCRVKDGTEVARLQASSVRCLAVSSDGRWIAAGTFEGETLVWDAKTHKQVLKGNGDGSTVQAVDFSPDSTRLISGRGTAIIFDIATHKQIQTLSHSGWIIAAKYSPQGDRIATATWESVCVWDSNDGCLLADIPVKVTLSLNRGLVWFNDLLVVSGDKIKQVDPSTGLTVSEWPLPGNDTSSCIALPKHRKFIAYSTRDTVTFWDRDTHTQLDVIRHTETVRSIAFSPDDRNIAIGGEHVRTTIHRVSDFIPFALLYNALHEIDVWIDVDVLDFWMNNRLENAEVLSTAVISTSDKPTHDLLTNRALVREHLGKWDNAIVDAAQSLRIEPSAIAYIALSAALVRKGERDKAYRTCDIAIWRFHLTDDPFLLLIKAVIVFMCGEHKDAISRIDDIIRVAPSSSACYTVQSYMLLLLANSCVESSDYNDAVQYLEHAIGQVQPITGVMRFISSISGWTFDNLKLRIQQRLCEALYATGHIKEAGESLLALVYTVEEDVEVMTSITNWASDLLEKCLSAPETHRDAALDSQTPLLRVWTKLKLSHGSWKKTLNSVLNFTPPRMMIHQALCDHLEMTDHVTEAVECFRRMDNELVEETGMHVGQEVWAADFVQRCARKLEHLGDVAADAQKHDEAIAQYSTALSLGPVTPQDILTKRSKACVVKRLWEDAINDANQVVTIDPSTSWNTKQVLVEWAKVELTGEGWKNAVVAARDFKVTMFSIYQTLCERLANLVWVTDSVECLLEMVHNLGPKANSEETKWIEDFKDRCGRRLEDLGDAAVDAERFDEAVSQYSAALSLGPAAPQSLLVKRSKAHTAMKSWQSALDDANEVITLDPSSPLGHERRYIALRGSGSYVDAMNVFEVMLSTMLQSSDPEDRARYQRYEETKTAIRTAIKNVTRKLPLRLINTNSGQLLDKSAQEQSFESQPIFLELISSAIASVDHPWIQREVEDYYRYAMFSHKWEGVGEPLFEKIVQIIVYDLEQSLTHDKLKMFCKIARDLGLRWAWSDTCCINKGDHFELQEALVMMFQWYEDGAVTIVSLRGVRSPSMRGDLTRSIWNTRMWTYQEYHASKVVRFYTEDWRPYLDLDVPNHKGSPEIIAEMEEATGVSARVLIGLRPGLDSIREKLRLASTRHTTRIEDEAYSLLGIFSMSLPVVYGEADKALGRLLAQLLTNSGDASILAWTGRSGGFNSCLPSNINSFSELPTTHVPQGPSGAEMDTIVARLRSSPLNSTSLMNLHDRLYDLPAPMFAGQRMKLPCIVFKLGRLSISRNSSRLVFYAQTVAGPVEIATDQNLSQFSSLYLIHPWIDALLDRHPVSGVLETILEDGTNNRSSTFDGRELPAFPNPSPIVTSTAPQTLAAMLIARVGQPFGWSAGRSPQADSMSLQPSTISPGERTTQALEMLVRLSQPFGALLLAPSGGAVYRRVVTEGLITARFKIAPETGLDKLIGCVRILDVL